MKKSGIYKIVLFYGVKHHKLDFVLHHEASVNMTGILVCFSKWFANLRNQCGVNRWHVALYAVDSQ